MNYDQFLESKRVRVLEDGFDCGELKTSYFNLAVQNCKNAELGNRQIQFEL